ncbi:hypothetical protein ABE485_05915 [Achromobacter spanius]|uniref:hypothetical protein n=1 Tax=Achromobacter spanius TaxID=217203 RepID=UPI00320833AE
MPFIPFPDAPAVPGVPAIFRETTIPSVSAPGRFELGAIPELIFGPPRWGLYGEDGRQALVFETFLGISFKQGGQVSTVTGEKDRILTSDKVDLPYEATIKLAHSGDKTSRAAMLSELERIVRGTDLYDVATPEFTYPSVNPVKYSYERGEKNGASLLVVELTLLQVRRKPATESSDTKEPSGATKQSNGQAQASTMKPDSGRAQNGAGTERAIQ